MFMPYRNHMGEVKEGRPAVRSLLRTFARFYAPKRRAVKRNRLFKRGDQSDLSCCGKEAFPEVKGHIPVVARLMLNSV
jgi:hypothetical protein